jgi:hypothetical protein
VVRDEPRLALDAVEHGQHFQRRHLEVRLLLHLPDERVLERLAELDRAPGNDPAAAKRLLASPDEQHPAFVDDDASHPDGGPVEPRSRQ